MFTRNCLPLTRRRLMRQLLVYGEFRFIDSFEVDFAYPLDISSNY